MDDRNAAGPLLAALLLLTTTSFHRLDPPSPPADPGLLGTVTLVAVGDVLMHQDVKTAGAHAPGGLGSLWRDVEPLLKGADLAFANLETPVAPRVGRPGRPFVFNAPAELPEALRSSGFSVLSTANNHAFDQGGPGVRETLERLEAQGLTAVGSGTDRAGAEAPRILVRNGLRVAFLAFTDLFNQDLDRSPDEPWVRRLDPATAPGAVRAARAQADAVVVSLHWGTEYSHVPGKRQRGLVRSLVEAGADVILGHHPHVLQPVEVVESGARRALVAYSLGNFISNQDRMYRADRFPPAGGDNRDGVLLQCRLVCRRNPDGTVGTVVEDVRCEPLWTDNNWGDIRAGRTRTRVVRVLRVKDELRRVREELGGLLSAPGDDPARAALVGERQLACRTLVLRQERCAAILGAGFVSR